MAKILAVIEDFNILVGIETNLKKVGFDVVGVFNDYSLTEKVLSVRPDVIVIFGRGQRVNHLAIGKKLKDIKNIESKVLILIDENQKLSPAELAQMKIDGILELPLDNEKLIEAISKLLNLDPTNFIEKLHKAESAPKNYSPDKKLIYIGGGEGLNMDDTKFVFQSQITPQIKIDGKIPKVKVPAADETEKKVEGYKKFLQGVEIQEESSIRRSETKKIQEEWKKSWDDAKLAELEGLDKQKREFVKALFKKNKS